MKKRGRRPVHDRAWQAMLVCYVITEKVRRRVLRGRHYADTAVCTLLVRRGLYPGMTSRSLRSRLVEARKAITGEEIDRILVRIPFFTPEEAARLEEMIKEERESPR